MRCCTRKSWVHPQWGRTSWCSSTLAWESRGRVRASWAVDCISCWIEPYPRSFCRDTGWIGWSWSSRGVRRLFGSTQERAVSGKSVRGYCAEWSRVPGEGEHRWRGTPLFRDIWTLACHSLGSRMGSQLGRPRQRARARAQQQKCGLTKPLQWWDVDWLRGGQLFESGCGCWYWRCEQYEAGLNVRVQRK